jgi:hypothetical protein
MERGVGFEWDPRKAEANYKKHGVRFAEALPVFEDDHAITVTDEDSDPHEARFVTIGRGGEGKGPGDCLLSPWQEYPRDFDAQGIAARAPAI